MALLVCRSPLVPTGASQLPSWMRGTPEASQKGGESFRLLRERERDRPRTEAPRIRKALQGPLSGLFRQWRWRNCRLRLVPGAHMTAALMKSCRPHWPAECACR